MKDKDMIVNGIVNGFSYQAQGLLHTRDIRT